MKRPLSTMLSMLAAGLAAAAAAKAQETDQAVRARIQERIQEMREAIKDGLPVITSVRVAVQLRNAHKINGVVKQGRFIEKVDGLDFVPADMKSPGAGLRIWYFNNTNAYVFLPFDAIASYRIGARLTDLQIKEIESKIEVDRRRAEEAKRAYLAAKDGGDDKAKEEEKAKEGDKAKAEEKGKEKGAGEQVAGGEDAEAQKREEERLLGLLAEFPADEGWGEARIREIETRKVTVGVYPDARAKRFIEVFPDWQRAVQLQQHKQKLASSAAEPTAPHEGAAAAANEGQQHAAAPPPAETEPPAVEESPNTEPSEPPPGGESNGEIPVTPAPKPNGGGG